MPAALRKKPRRRVLHGRSQRGDGLEQLIRPLLKVAGPLIATELARFGIQTGLKKIAGRGHRGKGLLLAGQKRGAGRGLKATFNRASRRSVALRIKKSKQKKRALASRRAARSKAIVRRTRNLPQVIKIPGVPGVIRVPRALR